MLGESGGQRDVVQRLLGKVACLQGALSSAEATRRRLHNELVEVRGNVSGALRRRHTHAYWACALRPHGASPIIECPNH